MSNVIILGDPHIGKGLNLGKVGVGSTLNSRIIDQVNILDWTLEQALDNDATDIIVTGDVFEEPKPHPSLITLLINWLKQCALHHVNVHIIMGNHDIFRTGNYYTSALDIVASCELDNVSVYKDVTTIYINSIAFTFMPFRDRKSFGVASNAEAIALLTNQLVYEILAIPMTCTKVLVGHLALAGSIPVGDEIDDLSNELMCPLNMFRAYNYVWMGHVHKPQVLSQNPYIAHLGSMEISNFGETDQKKKIVLFDVEEGSFQYKTIPTRQFKKIVISIPKDIKDTTKYVIEELNKYSTDLNKSIVRLEVHLTSPELLPINRADIESILYKFGVHNIVAILESKKLTPIKKDTGEIITMSIDVLPAIKMYAAAMIEEDKRETFTTLAFDMYAQYKRELK